MATADVAEGGHVETQQNKALQIKTLWNALM